MTITRFIDRDSELGYLEEELKKPGFRLVSIIGRRRVGKTRLVQEFLRGKSDFLYFYVPFADDLDLRMDFAKRLMDEFEIPFVGRPGWQELLEGIFKTSARRRMILVFDEFQRFREINRAVPSILQGLIDRYKSKSRLFIAVSGSAIGMMTEMFAHAAPLYGRRTGQIFLSPLSYGDVKQWLGLGEEKCIEYYSVFGGTPLYLEAIEGGDLMTDIERNILSKRSVLYNEPELMLKTELKDADTYFNILKQISLGKNSVKEIADTLSIKNTSMSYFLGILEDRLDIVRREAPVTEKRPEKSKMGRYFIKDNFFKFWFRYVYPYQSLLEMERKDSVLELVENDMNSYIGRVFEDVVREKLLRSDHPFRFTRMGSWWSRSGEEIDVVGLNARTGDILFAEVKWTARKVDHAVIRDLLAKADLVDWNKAKRQEHFIVVSKAGVTKKALDVASSENIETLDLKGLTELQSQ